MSSFSCRVTPQYSVKRILLLGFSPSSPPLQNGTVDCVAESLANEFCCTEIVKKYYLKIINHTSAGVMKGLAYTHKSREEKGQN